MVFHYMLHRFTCSSTKQVDRVSTTHHQSVHVSCRLLKNASQAMNTTLRPSGCPGWTTPHYQPRLPDRAPRQEGPGSMGHSLVWLNCVLAKKPSLQKLGMTIVLYSGSTFGEGTLKQTHLKGLYEYFRALLIHS